MNLINVDWGDIKSFSNSRSLPLQYLDISGTYHIRVFDGSFGLSCEIIKQTIVPVGSDQEDFEDNYKAAANKNLSDIDSEGRKISRLAYGNKGWVYIAHPLEFTTSKLNSCFSKNWQNTDRGDIVFKFYDTNGTELVAGTQAELDTSCVETRVTLKPDYDYEIISGTIDQKLAPTQDVRMWVVGGVINTTTNSPWEYPAASGIFHAKEFAGGLNLRYMGSEQQIKTDGRSSKFMEKTTAGVPYATNQFQIIVRHPAGYNHDLMIIFEYYRA